MNTKKLLSIAVSALAFSMAIGTAIVKHSAPKEVEAATYNQSVNDYYSSINWNQTGATLKTALFNKIKITTAGWSYDGLWTAYKTTDVRPDGIHFWDIYADSTDYTLNDSRINNSYKKEGDSINREHVIPQSSFNEAAPMKSDVHHVLPSDGYVNNRRSAYPHGIVTGSPTYTSNDGCKLGNGASGQGTVFEPMDQYKGDIARIYFYFVTCYQDKMSNNSFSAFDKFTYPSISSKYLSTYLKWAKEDPVSKKEIDRNNAAYAGQGNRNPFIDCPYAVGAIWDSEHASDYGTKGEYSSGEGVSISKESVSMISGGTTTVSATSTNSSNITWTTSNSSVVSLSSNSSSSGNSITLTAGNSGTATITASATINSKSYSKTCSVSVAATKQVSSISISGQKTSFAIDDTFSFGGTVTAAYNDDTSADVTASATFSGYDMSTAGSHIVTVSYSYGGKTVTTTYQIVVSASGGSDSIDDYTVSTSPLTSSGITSGMKVVFGTLPTNLATSISSNWIYLSSTRADWLVFTLEGSASGFTLRNGENYIYCSAAKKVEFNDSSSTTFKINASNYVYNDDAGVFYYNSSGLRPYTSGSSSYTDAFLYPLIPNATLEDVNVSTLPTKLSYEVGDTFDPTGLVITREYSDNSEDTYTYAGHESEFTFIPSLVTPLTIEDDSIEVVYSSISCFFEIEIGYPLVLTSIELFENPATTSFVEGDDFVFDGVVIANYEDDSIADITSEVSFSGYNMTQLGNQTVTISYQGESTSYSINVAPGTLSSIAVSGQTTSFAKNSTFYFNGTCTATFENGYEKVVTPTSVSSPDMSTLGSKTVTVSYSYEGISKSTTYQITITSNRTVIEEVTTDIDGTVTWPSSSDAHIEGDLSNLTVSLTGKTVYESSSIRVGTGSGGGSINISSTSGITKVDVVAKYYSSSYSSAVLKVDGQSIDSLTSGYKTYSVTLSSAKTSVSILTENSSSRVNIQSITLYSTGTTQEDISNSEDCLGLESFISEYMHMDYSNDQGWCKDSEHHYYATAKAAFNNLNEHQRELYTTNSAYEYEWERLSTWAYYNGDVLNETYELERSPFFNKTNNVFSSDKVVAIVAISLVGLSTLGLFVFLRKRKENY